MFFVYGDTHSASLGLYLNNKPIGIDQISKANFITTANGSTILYQNKLSPSNMTAMNQNPLYKGSKFALDNKSFDLECTLVCDSYAEHVKKINRICELFAPGVPKRLILEYLPGLACDCYLNGPIKDTLQMSIPSFKISLMAPDPLLYAYAYTWPVGSALDALESN